MFQRQPPGGNRVPLCWRCTSQEGRLLRPMPLLGVGLSQQNDPPPLDSPVTLSVALSVDRLTPMFSCSIAGVWPQKHLSTHLNAWKCNASQHFRVQIMGQAILVRSNNAMVMVYVNHQGAPGWTRGTRGPLCRQSTSQEVRMLRSKPSLGVGLSQQNCPLTLGFSGSHVCLSKRRGVGP